MRHIIESQLREPRAACWISCMRRGAFEAAWAISDAMLQTRAGIPGWDWPRHLQYIWDGTPLDGKRGLGGCYQGAGDPIQFIRYAPLIKDIAREVIVWAQPVLLPLPPSVRGIDRLLAPHERAAH